MDDSFDSEGLRLAAHFARPPHQARVRGLVLCHGFPSGPRGAATSGATYPELADRIVRHCGWAVLTFNFRGTGSSEGDFSIEGWMADLRAAVAELERRRVTGVWLAGAGMGGVLAICVAAGGASIRGVATLGAYASLRDWGRDPGRFVEHVRRIGMIRDPAFPPDPAAWARAVAELDPVAAAARIPPRPFLVLHGSADDRVPVEQARRLARAAPGSVLQVVHAAGHRLRHDPRAVAALLGWLDRQVY
ncbi:MAG: prolyl oligopeptidase family serine peptidase [Acidimicrobiia bacterium]|nr:prolyl oligopeptidase family serine peptidase [Acidimicrobiia bacterium]